MAKIRALTIALVATLGCDEGSTAAPAAQPAAKPAQPDAEPAQPDAKPGAQPEAKPDDVKPEAKPEAVAAPKPEAAPDGNPEAKSAARATGAGNGIDLVILHSHALLKSELRAVTRLESTLKKAGLEVELFDPVPPERDEALTSWMNTVDPAARAKLPSDDALDTASAVIAISFRPEERRVSQNQDRLVVLQRGDSPEVVWVNIARTGVYMLEDPMKSIIPLVADLEGAK